MRHEILQEDGHAEVFANVAAWLDEKVGRNIGGTGATVAGRR